MNNAAIVNNFFRRFLLGGECTFGCPRGYFHLFDGDIVRCFECDSSCAQCLGPTAADCSSCKANHSLLDGNCVKRCPPQYFTFDGACIPCHYSCLTCSGQNNDKITHKFVYKNLVSDAMSCFVFTRISSSGAKHNISFQAMVKPPARPAELVTS